MTLGRPECYIFEERCWKPMENLNIGRFGASAIRMNSSSFAMSGKLIFKIISKLQIK